MSSADLAQSIRSLSTSGWQWTDTNGQVSARQLQPAPPLDHLYDYALASIFLVLLEIPADLTAGNLA